VSAPVDEDTLDDDVAVDDDEDDDIRDILSCQMTTVALVTSTCSRPMSSRDST